MDFTDKAFTMGDGTRLLVVEQVDYEDRTYLLVVNSNDEQDLRFVELCGEYLNEIDPLKFRTEIWPLFVKKFRSYGEGENRDSTSDILLRKLINSGQGEPELSHNEKCFLFLSFSTIVLTIMFFYYLFIFIINRI